MKRKLKAIIETDSGNRLILPETVSEQVLCQTESGSNITLTSLLNGYADEINSLRETISSLAGGGGTFLLSIAFAPLLIGKPFHVVGIGTDFVVDRVVVGGGKDVVEVPYANTDYEIVCDGFSTTIGVDRYFGYYYGEIKTGTPLGSKAVGDIVKIGVNGQLWDFIVVQQGSPSSLYSGFDGGTVVLMKDIYEMRQWHSSDVNDYANSSIHSYGNNTFLPLVDGKIRPHIKQVRIPYRPGSGSSATVNSGLNGLLTNVWTLSVYEAYTNITQDIMAAFSPVDGAVLSYFSGAADEKRKAYLGGTVTAWALRTVTTVVSSIALTVGTTGEINSAPCTDLRGYRPAFVLPNTLFVTDK